MKPPSASFFRFLLRASLAGAALAPLLAQAGSIVQQHAASLSPGGRAGGTSSIANSSVSQTTTAATSVTSQAPQTAAMVQHAQLSLQHSLQILQARQSAQSAARAAALTAPSSVPDGLFQGLPGSPSGLVPIMGLSGPGISNPVPVGSTTWVNAHAPTQTSSNGKTTVTVTQTGQQALLNWLSFNIGKNTKLNFDQSLGGANVGNWVALNKVAPSIAPSQILGAIQAPGQVYVINQNGIIFGGASQVNVGALVASSLPINDNLVARGLLNNPDDQFLFSQLDIPALSGGSMPAFTAPPVPAGGVGDVTVEAGAQLTSPTNAKHSGGKIALIGPNVTNAGTISTPDGQTILAAGNQVGLAAHDANDPSLRGLDVYVGAVNSTSGTARNTGTIDSPRANITIAGKAVDQSGVINSSTSVAYNGRVDLLADYESTVTISTVTNQPQITPTASGEVTFGANSLTQILPELASTETAVGAQLALSSLVNIQGQNIHLADQALLLAPSASLPSDATKPALGVGGTALTAGVTLDAGNWLLNGTAYAFFNTTGNAASGKVSLGQGASIDVSGSENVAASVAENILKAQLLGTELANSPVQRNGPLRGQTIDFDLRQTGVNADGSTWIGTPLADLSGYVNLVPHTVGGLTTAGGTVAIKAGGTVSIQPDATVNVSGGWINYQGATIQTTQLLANGQIIDISQANPNVVYEGSYQGTTISSTKWGTSQTYTNPLLTGSQYEPGYIQGGNGGGISITAPNMTLGGNFYGNTVAGPLQRTLASTLKTTYAGANFLPTVLATQAMPESSSLTLNFQGISTSVSSHLPYSPTPARIDFGNSQAAGDLVLSPDLVNNDGFGHLTIKNGDGSIFVPANVSLTTAPGGSISLAAANLDIEGSLIAPDGALTFNVYDYSPFADTFSPVTGEALQATPDADTTRGQFRLGSTATLSTAGLIVDDRATAPTAGSITMATDGGMIAINSYSIDFAAGSTLDVSGGASVSAVGKVNYGKGGSLSILAGQDPNISSLVGGNFSLGSTLRGYSGAMAGSLTIQAPLVQVGGTAIDPANTLEFRPDFFTRGALPGLLSEGGFGSFHFIGLGEVAPNQPDSHLYLPAVNITSGVVVSPVVQSWQADLGGNTVALTAITQPLASQRSPANLAFTAEGVSGFGGGVLVRGDLLDGAGSLLQTDPKGSVTLEGQTVQVLGQVLTPSGTITVRDVNFSNDLFANGPDVALVTVDLGANSFLSAAGTVLPSFNAYGYSTGSVTSGGNITVSGNILAEQGAVIDVSGASGVLDVLPTQAGSPSSPRLVQAPYVSTRVDSSGGSITLAGRQELFSAATLRGGAGGRSAVGGNLVVKSGFYTPQAEIDQPTTPLHSTLEVVQSLPASASNGIGHVVDVQGSPIELGYFAADSFNASGLDSLSLKGTVQFSGPVQITAHRSLTVGTSGVISADAAVSLTAPYVALGQAFQGPLNLTQQALPVFLDSAGNAVPIAPVFGTGHLSVHAGSLLDVGNLSLQGVGSVNLAVANGDLRGDGTLDVAGELNLAAGQIYPTTESTFTLAAFDHDGTAGSVNLTGSGTRSLPYSAGGTLNVFASDIAQGGILRAPIGTINLGSGVTAANPVDPLSGQAFDPAQQVTLSSGSVTSVSAIDPVTGRAMVLPYGLLRDGVSWIDPAGNDITASGNGPNAIPDKAIHITGANVADQTGATIDVRGGGDLSAYRFVSGTGGTNDILSSTSSFAVIPTYTANYAPGYSPTDYTNAGLAVGQQIYLSGSNGLAAGFYTLLPARYALQPGAFLITPKTGAPPSATATQTDGSSIVSGYTFDGLGRRPAAPLFSSYEVASQAVVRARAQYDTYSANTFLGQKAAAGNVAVPRLPQDAGQLVLAATQTLSIHGSVLSQAPSGGLGSEVDIASPSSILVGSAGTTAAAGTLVLDAADLSAFGADSLLIGGYRSPTTLGTQVTVTTGSLTVANAGSPLTGPDIILASNQSLAIASGAVITQTGSLSGSAQTLLLGQAGTAGSGDGALVRVSSDVSAQILRTGVDAANGPALSIGAGAKISGNGLTLDSTATTLLDATAQLNGNSVSISSGQISLVLDASTPASGFVLSGDALTGIQASTKALSLLSYSSIDIYEDGSGAIGAPVDGAGKYQVQSLALHAGEIRGFDGGTVAINAQKVILDNSTGALLPPSASGPAGGDLVVNAATIQLGGGAGVNTLQVAGYANVDLNASGGILLRATPSVAKDSSGNPLKGTARLVTAGNLAITAPVITGASGASQTLAANGDLTINPLAGGSTATVTGGLGATLNLVGATVTENSKVLLSSGNLRVEATGGDVVIGGKLDVSGTAKGFGDLTEYTSGGQIALKSDTGSVILASGSTTSVGANPAGGDAGSLTVTVPGGSFQFAGAVLQGQGGTGGSFDADLATIPGGSLQALDALLNGAGFTGSIALRDRTDANLTLDGTVRAGQFALSLDQGSITVTGTIDASNVAASDSTGKTIQVGGSIDLIASGSVTLAAGSKLTVAGKNFNNAGKGGTISLEAGAETKGAIDQNALLDLQAGSTLDLSVAAANNASPAAGDYSGTLHLRAPQTADHLDVQINPINGTIIGASSITVEGYRLYNLSDAAGSQIDGGVEGDISQNGTTFTGNAAAITNRLLAPSGNLASPFNVVVGAEIINPTGDLVLANDWDLSTFRFGPNNAPGVLTLRAAGNLIFQGSLSDGFNPDDGTLMTANFALPANLQSWSYRLTAGAAFSAADFHQVTSSMESYDSATGLAVPGTSSGSLQLGNFVGSNNGNPLAPGGTTADASAGYNQVIRTGTGDIDIATAGDVLLQNQFATIYTAGAQVADPTLNGKFSTPVLRIGRQTFYPAQYSVAGGNVTIAAQGNIAHITQDNNGIIVIDSEKQLPNNWLYRRGYVDPRTSQFGTTRNRDIASTSWWIDFSNFFEGIGTLGGGNVTLNAGHDVSNVDAVAPTNARMTFVTDSGDLLAAHQTLVEFGGGDVVVRAGRDINGGAYYVERGQGKIEAGDSIVTNATRSPSLGTITIPASVGDAQTWLPTTLFLGKGSFAVNAAGDVLLGPVANPFLLPQGVGNTYWDKTYFSTYAATDAVNVSSVTGNVTLRESATLAGASTATPLLGNWFQAVDLLTTSPQSVSYDQPWLKITETSVDPFTTVESLLPGTLQVAAFTGDINTVGNLTLSPAARGTVNLVAGGAINGLQPSGVTRVLNNTASQAWSSSRINLSDADPAAIPSVLNPYASGNTTGTGAQPSTTNVDFAFIDNLFAESGSFEGTAGVLQTKLQLHGSIHGAPLHAGDPDPIHLYATTGSISGLTLFSGKAARVVAGQDLTDVALYIQNVSADDTTVVAAGRDIIAYNAASPLRVAAQSAGNALDLGDSALAGDIQISGPGTLEILAGRNLNLGVGPNNPDGTAVGITSIGNQRNPSLPFGGADVVALAGVGPAAGLNASQLDFRDSHQLGFIDQFLNPATGGKEAARYLPDLGQLLGLTNSTDVAIWNAFNQLSPEKQDNLALDLFYLILREAGRDHNTSSLPGARTYEAGFAAIKALFPTSKDWQGDISLTSREIKTENGGNISLLAPGGQLDVGLNVAGTQPLDQGILTEDGGNISIFTKGDVNVGTSRIFTLNGGNEIIWSSFGGIAAGASSKTVQSAPPTRVLIDPQSGSVQTDLAGLATGGGIGVLATRDGTAPSDVDLIAPNGTVNAGDAGIRASGNLSIAAVQVLNASNITAGGKSSGVPTTTVPNVGALVAGSTLAGAANSFANQAAKQAQSQAAQPHQDIPSLITVEVVGYGGGESDWGSNSL